jgi:hypothetical protein
MDDVFLLSPAHCGGRRAQMLLREGSGMALARQLAAGELTLGAAFTFLSGLYFRGKLAYAATFGAAYVITPTRGLQPPDLPLTPALVREFASVDIGEDNRRYRRALEHDATDLAERLSRDARVVLLGSIATGKYVDVLRPILGDWLHYPADFVGRGDMSRGGVVLRSRRSGRPLEYARLDSDVRPRGPRPPRLVERPERREPRERTRRGGGLSSGTHHRDPNTV